MKCLLLILALAISAQAQKTAVLWMVFPPLISPGVGCGAGTPNYSSINAAVLPHVDGVAVSVFWTQGFTVNGQDIGFESSTVAGSYNFSQLTKCVIAPYEAQTCNGHACKVRIIVGPADSTHPNGNDMAPSYVYTQAWANNACNNFPYATATVYYPNQCVLSGGQYFQMTKSTNCTSNGASPGVDVGCTWGTGNANAPLQDASWQAGGYVGGTCAINQTGMPTTGGIWNLGTATCNGGACTTANLACGYPITWETPMTWAHYQMVKALQANYANDPQIDSIRTGISTQGEGFFFDQSNLTTSATGWPVDSNVHLNPVIYGYHGYFFGLIKPLFTGGRPQLMASFNNCSNNQTACNDPEATNIANLGIGGGEQGMQQSDISNYHAGKVGANDGPAMFQANGASFAFCEVQANSEFDPSNAFGGAGSAGFVMPWFQYFMSPCKAIHFEILSTNARGAYLSGYTDSLYTGTYAAPWTPDQQVYSGLVVGRSLLPAPSSGLVASKDNQLINIIIDNP